MRYTIRPAAWTGWDDAESVSPPSMQIECAPARFTGLLDANGHQIWNEPDPIGFRFQEQDKPRG